jgi:hypothetical protein
MVVVDPVAAGTAGRGSAATPAAADGSQQRQLGQAAEAKMERLYVVEPSPCAATLEMLAAASNSPVPVVDRWFQRRRAREEHETAVRRELDASLDSDGAAGVEDLARVNRALMQQEGLSDSDSELEQPELEPEPEPEPEPPAPVLSAEETPDFSGRWVLAETVGMEGFLTALDIGYIKRTVALRVAESLVGKAEQDVEQSGDRIVFTARGPNNPEGTPSRFEIGRSDNINENPLLGTVTTGLRWSTAKGGVALDAQMTTADGRQSSMRRWLVPAQKGQAEALYVETTFGGASMCQRFDCVERRKGAPPAPPSVVQAAQQAAPTRPAQSGPPPLRGDSDKSPPASTLRLVPAGVAAAAPQVARVRKRRQPSPREAARMAAVKNEHPVAQVALTALKEAEPFLSDGWGEATMIADGAAKIWRRISGSPGAKVVPVKTEGTVKGIDHISLRKLLVSAELKAAMSEVSSATMLNLRTVETVEIRANDTCATATAWYHTSKFPWPLQAREVCFVNCWTAVPDPRTGKKRGRQFVIERSLQHERCPTTSSFTRMTVDLVFCLEADGEDTRMTVCAEVDPGGDIPTRVVELAVSQMTDRLRNIADTIKTHRTLVDKILRTQSVVDDDTSSTDEEDEDEDEAEGDGKQQAETDGEAAASLSSHRPVKKEMLELGTTQAFIVPEVVSQPACAKAGVEWSDDHARLAASGDAGVVIKLTRPNAEEDEAAVAEAAEPLVHLRWLERREEPSPPPSEPFSPDETEEAADGAAVAAEKGDEVELGPKEVRIEVLHYEEGRTVDGFWTVDKFQHPGRHVRYVILVRTRQKTYELRRRYQQISDFNAELLKLSNGWLKLDDRWTTKKLPSSWSRPGFNAAKLEQRMNHLRAYFTSVAEWLTRLRSKPDRVIDMFAPDLHPRMHVVRDFLVAGSLSHDTAAALLQGPAGGGGTEETLGRSRTASMSSLSSGADQGEEEDTNEEEQQLRRSRSASLGGGVRADLTTNALSPAAAAALTTTTVESTADDAGLTELILVVPLACIALLEYPPEPEPAPVALTGSPMVDDGHLGRVAMSLADLSLVYHDAGVDMSSYDDEDKLEQQKLQRLRSKTLEDLSTVNAAVEEARVVAALAGPESPIASPRSSTSSLPQSPGRGSFRGSFGSSTAGGPAEEPMPEGWEGVTVSVGSIGTRIKPSTLPFLSGAVFLDSIVENQPRSFLPRPAQTDTKGNADGTKWRRFRAEMSDGSGGGGGYGVAMTPYVMYLLRSILV